MCVCAYACGYLTASWSAVKSPNTHSGELLLRSFIILVRTRCLSCSYTHTRARTHTSHVTLCWERSCGSLRAGKRLQGTKRLSGPTVASQGDTVSRHKTTSHTHWKYSLAYGCINDLGLGVYCLPVTPQNHSGLTSYSAFRQWL